MRRVIHVPLIHSPEEMGNIKTPPKLVRAATREWEIIGNKFEELEVNGAKVYVDSVYDGIDIQDPRLDTFPMIRATRGLVQRGAIHVPAEDQSLLMRHIAIVMKLQEVRWNLSLGLTGIAAVPNMLEFSKLAKLSEEVRELRDKHIAGVVNETLEDGGLGIMMFGARHEAHQFLDPSIAVEPLAEELRVVLEKATRGLRSIEQQGKEVNVMLKRGGIEREAV